MSETTTTEPGTEYFLNDTWNLYFHDPYDNNWNTTSYHCLGSISSVHDFWYHFLSLKPNVHKGMFFIMREHVFPIWDDPSNINGGCISIKVLKENMAEFLELLCISLLGETLLVEDRLHLWDNINGISSSPKKSFCIIKIWLKNDNLNDKKYFNIKGNYYGDIIYKSNMDNIMNDNMRKH